MKLKKDSWHFILNEFCYHDFEDNNFDLVLPSSLFFYSLLTFFLPVSFSFALIGRAIIRFEHLLGIEVFSGPYRPFSNSLTGSLSVMIITIIAGCLMLLPMVVRVLFISILVGYFCGYKLLRSKHPGLFSERIKTVAKKTEAVIKKVLDETSQIEWED